ARRRGRGGGASGSAGGGGGELPRGVASSCGTARKDGILTQLVAEKIGAVVGCGDPLASATAAATVAEHGTVSRKGAVLTPPPPRRKPAGLGLPPAITQSSYVFPEGAAGSWRTASAAPPLGATTSVPKRPCSAIRRAP